MPFPIGAPNDVFARKLASKGRGCNRMNCLPFLGHEKWEVFFMHVDLRMKHDVETRKAVVRLFD